LPEQFFSPERCGSKDNLTHREKIRVDGYIFVEKAEKK
jgi:hypothetical protein